MEINAAHVRAENAPRPRLGTSHLIVRTCTYMHGQLPNKNAELVSENKCRARVRRKRASTPPRGITPHHPTLHMYALTTPSKIEELVNENRSSARVRRKRASIPPRGIPPDHPSLYLYARTAPQ